MNTLLIALDFSRFSPEVEARGYALAERIGASVTLISITPVHIEYARPDTGQVFIDDPEANQQETKASLEKISQAHTNVTTEIISAVGDPKKAIVEVITRLTPSFVVVGTHGRTGLSHFLVGSVAEYVIRHSPVPVLVVPYRTDKH